MFPIAWGGSRPYEGKRIATPVCALARNDTGFGRLRKRTVGDAGPYKGKRIATGINALGMTPGSIVFIVRQTIIYLKKKGEVYEKVVN